MKYRGKAADDEEPATTEPVEVGSSSSGAIHIVLSGEVRISVEGSIDPAIVRAVLKIPRP